MKLVIVSDSHGSREEIRELQEKYRNKVDALIHCGDSELAADEAAINDYIIVRGNCDMESKFPNQVVEEIKGRKIFVTHGHLYNIKMSLMNLQYKAKENMADFVFFGHSHTLGAEMIDGCVFLNPGSILLPRGRKERTYALVESINEKIQVQFLTHDHKVVESKEFALEKK
jgi:uncharacterized protein